MDSKKLVDEIMNKIFDYVDNNCGGLDSVLIMSKKGMDKEGMIAEETHNISLAEKLVKAGYGDVKQYQDRIKQLEEENENLIASLEVAKQDKANIERTLEEVKELLSACGINIDCDGNVTDSRLKNAVKEFAENKVKPLIDKLMELIKEIYYNEINF